MKKGISLLLILAMLLTVLCACESQKSDKKDRDDKSDRVEDILDDEKDVEVSRGETKTADYINDSIGVKFTLADDTWRFYTNEELATMMNISADAFLKVEVDANTLTQLIDFGAVQTSTGCSVNLCIEPLSRFGNTDMTREEYVELAKNQLEMLSSYKITFGEQKEVSLGSHEYLRIAVEMNYGGVLLAQNMYIRKVGEYMVTISAGGPKGIMEAEAFEKMFS